MFFTAVLFGLISSLHCIGMCGPIVMMLPVDRKNKTKKAAQILTYHFGRILAYASIGFIFGLLGQGFFMAGFQQQLSIFVGILMIVFVLVPSKITAKYNFSNAIFRIIGNVKAVLRNQFKNKSYQSLFAIGFLNGFLPCGMLYVALFGAIAMQSPFFGSLYMILFGFGTIPLLSSVLYLDTFLSISARNKIQKMMPIVVICIGLLFICRGLGLGIPYISPSTLSLFIQAKPNCH